MPDLTVEFVLAFVFFAVIVAALSFRHRLLRWRMLRGQTHEFKTWIGEISLAAESNPDVDRAIRLLAETLKTASFTVEYKPDENCEMVRNVTFDDIKELPHE